MSKKRFVNNFQFIKILWRLNRLRISLRKKYHIANQIDGCQFMLIRPR